MIKKLFSLSVLVGIVLIGGQLLAKKRVKNPVSPLVHISGLTAIVPPAPFSTDTSFLKGDPTIAAFPSTLYRNCEEETVISVNPTDKSNMVCTFHQDRYCCGGGSLGTGVRYTFDGGISWQVSFFPTTIYEVNATGGDCKNNPVCKYYRASDPWVSFGPSGICHASFLGLYFNPARTDLLVADLLTTRSLDGGITWDAPQVVIASTTLAVLDKSSITADPFDDRLVYLVCDNPAIYNGASIGGPMPSQIFFTRSTDGGVTWQPTQILENFCFNFTTNIGTEPVGNIIQVLADGTLLLVWPNDQVPLGTTLACQQIPLTCIRSFDKGVTWESTPIDIATIYKGGPAGALIFDLALTDASFDSELGVQLRDSTFLPAIASNPVTGQVYVVFQDRRFNPSTNVGVVITTSKDLGKTWSTPVPVNPNTLSIQTFNPEVAVLPDGRVGVLYYDFRNAVGGSEQLATDVWLAILDADLNNVLQEIRVTPQSFDVRQMDFSVGFFVGDYNSLTTDGTDFIAAFVAANPCNDITNQCSFPPSTPTGGPTVIDPRDRQDIYFARINPNVGPCKKISLVPFRSITTALQPLTPPDCVVSTPILAPVGGCPVRHIAAKARAVQMPAKKAVVPVVKKAETPAAKPVKAFPKQTVAVQPQKAGRPVMRFIPAGRTDMVTL
jgi:hypothetical protein